MAKAPPSPSTQEPWTLKGTSDGWWAHFDLTTVCWTHLCLLRRQQDVLEQTRLPTATLTPTAVAHFTSTTSNTTRHSIATYTASRHMSRQDTHGLQHSSEKRKIDRLFQRQLETAMAASLQTPNTPPTPTSAKQLSSSARQTVPTSTHLDIPTDTATSIQPTHHNSQQSTRANHQKRHRHQSKLLPNNTPGAPQPAKTSPQVKSSTQRRGQQSLTARLQTSSQPSTQPHC